MVRVLRETQYSLSIILLVIGREPFIRQTKARTASIIPEKGDYILPGLPFAIFRFQTVENMPAQKETCQILTINCNVACRDPAESNTATSAHNVTKPDHCMRLLTTPWSLYTN